MTDEGNGHSCALCGRPLGRRRERHHLVPRRYGGRETVLLHPICHRKIHAVFRESELRRRYHDIATLKAHPEIAAFIRWLADKPPDFHRRTQPPRQR